MASYKKGFDFRRKNHELPAQLIAPRRAKVAYRKRKQHLIEWRKRRRFQLNTDWMEFKGKAFPLEWNYQPSDVICRTGNFGGCDGCDGCDGCESCAGGDGGPGGGGTGGDTGGFGGPGGPGDPGGTGQCISGPDSGFCGACTPGGGGCSSAANCAGGCEGPPTGFSTDFAGFTGPTEAADVGLGPGALAGGFGSEIGFGPADVGGFGPTSDMGFGGFDFGAPASDFGGFDFGAAPGFGQDFGAFTGPTGAYDFGSPYGAFAQSQDYGQLPAGYNAYSFAASTPSQQAERAGLVTGFSLGPLSDPAAQANISDFAQQTGLSLTEAAQELYGPAPSYGVTIGNTQQGFLNAPVSNPQVGIVIQPQPELASDTGGFDQFAPAASDQFAGPEQAPDQQFAGPDINVGVPGTTAPTDAFAMAAGPTQADLTASNIFMGGPGSPAFYGAGGILPDESTQGARGTEIGAFNAPPEGTLGALSQGPDEPPISPITEPSERGVANIGIGQDQPDRSIGAAGAIQGIDRNAAVEPSPEELGPGIFTADPFASSSILDRGIGAGGILRGQDQPFDYVPNQVTPTLDPITNDWLRNQMNRGNIPSDSPTIDLEPRTGMDIQGDLPVGRGEVMIDRPSGYDRTPFGLNTLPLINPDQPVASNPALGLLGGGFLPLTLDLGTPGGGELWNDVDRTFAPNPYPGPGVLPGAPLGGPIEVPTQFNVPSPAEVISQAFGGKPIEPGEAPGSYDVSQAFSGGLLGQQYVDPMTGAALPGPGEWGVPLPSNEAQPLIHDYMPLPQEDPSILFQGNANRSSLGEGILNAIISPAAAADRGFVSQADQFDRTLKGDRITTNEPIAPVATDALDQRFGNWVPAPEGTWGPAGFVPQPYQGGEGRGIAAGGAYDVATQVERAPVDTLDARSINALTPPSDPQAADELAAALDSKAVEIKAMPDSQAREELRSALENKADEIRENQQLSPQSLIDAEFNRALAEPDLANEQQMRDALMQYAAQQNVPFDQRFGQLTRPENADQLQRMLEVAGRDAYNRQLQEAFDTRAEQIRQSQVDQTQVPIPRERPPGAPVSEEDMRAALERYGQQRVQDQQEPIPLPIPRPSDEIAARQALEQYGQRLLQQDQTPEQVPLPLARPDTAPAFPPAMLPPVTDVPQFGGPGGIYPQLMTELPPGYLPVYEGPGGIYSSGRAALQSGDERSQSQVDQYLGDLAFASRESLDWQGSVVDLMKLLGMDSSLQAREQLAADLGYQGRLNGSPQMNNFVYQNIMSSLRGRR